ncbi:MAG: GIY-YIG nuclease family protein [Vicingaceae bacterium]
MEEETVVYILYSSKHQKQYTGCSTQLIARFHSHNELSNKGWTISYRPWKVVHVEFYKKKAEAIAREMFLKSGQGRQWIKDNIKFD